MNFERAARVVRRLRPSCVILLYHRVTEGVRDASRLSVSEDRFAEHMQVLRDSYRPTSLYELIQCHRRGIIPRHSVAVAFDDGYADNYLVGMRAGVLRGLGGYREGYTPEDLDLFLRLAERGRLANLAEVLFRYRLHLNSICHTKARFLNEGRHRTIEDACKRRGIDSEGRNIIQLRQSSIAETHLRWAWWALSVGNTATARKHALRAIRKAPLSVDSWRVLACALRRH